MSPPQGSFPRPRRPSASDARGSGSPRGEPAQSRPPADRGPRRDVVGSVASRAPGAESPWPSPPRVPGPTPVTRRPTPAPQRRTLTDVVPATAPGPPASYEAPTSEPDVDGTDSHLLPGAPPLAFGPPSASEPAAYIDLRSLLRPARARRDHGPLVGRLRLGRLLFGWSASDEPLRPRRRRRRGGGDPGRRRLVQGTVGRRVVRADAGRGAYARQGGNFPVAEARVRRRGAPPRRQGSMGFLRPPVSEGGVGRQSRGASATLRRLLQKLHGLPRV